MSTASVLSDSHPGDVAAVWDIKLADGNHKIVFEHGTTSGKRVISVDGIEVYSQLLGSVLIIIDLCIGL